MHMEVPGQGPTWHYDCGALKRTVMLQMARDLLAQVTGAAAGGAGAGAAAAAATGTGTAASAAAASASTQPKPPQFSTAVIRYRDVGENVKLLQQHLIRLGLLKQGGDDGVFGNDTLEAVRRFQSSKGLTVDGKVGPGTKARVIDAIAALDAQSGISSQPTS